MISKKNIAVFASGAGSNFISICNQVDEGFINGKIALLVSNNPNCKAVLFAKNNSKIKYYLVLICLAILFPSKVMKRLF